MTKRSRGVAVVAGIAVLGLLLVFAWRPSAPGRPAPTPTASADGEQADGDAETPLDNRYPARPRARTVASILAGRRNVQEGLTEALAVFGPKDPDLISAAGMALAGCGQVPFGELADADPRSGDLRKLRALEKLQIQCEGFDGSAFFKQLDTYEYNASSNALQQSRPEGRPAIAHRLVATSVSTFQLISAGHVLITHKRLPLGEILGDRAPADPLQLVGNWALAAELSTCARQLGCGPNSLPTLVICMNLGRCEPGQGYAQALENGLPAEDFRTVMAFRQWIARQRR